MTERASRAGTASRPQREAGGGELPLFRTREVLHLLGVTRRQLQYWTQTNLVRPSVKTRGGHHRYSFRDLVVLKAAKRLIDAGVSVQRIRASVRELKKTLPTMPLPLGELTVVATGDVLLVFEEGAQFDALLGDEWVFPVGEFYREVKAWQDRRTPRKVKRAPTGGVRRATSAKGA